MIKNLHRGYAVIGLHQPKKEVNVGGVLRAAGCYGASLVCVSGDRFQQSCADTQKQHRHMPLIQCSDLRNVLPYGATPVAIDLIDDAIPLPEYTHPDRAFYVFGPEDGTLRAEILSYCRDVVYVPTHYCMNLAAAVNVVLYDRMAKRGEASSRFFVTKPIED